MKVKFLSFVFLFSMAVSVQAHEEEGESHLKSRFYANIYLDLFYNYQDAAAVKDIISVGTFDVAPSRYSNFGMRISYKYFYGDVELGLDPDEPIRKLFISYEFMKDSILTIGRDTTIASYTFGQVSGEENGLVGFGTIGDIRAFMLRYNYEDFEVALVHSGSDNQINFDSLNNGVPVEADKSQVRREQLIPRLEAAYFISDDGYEIKLFGSVGYYSSIVISPTSDKKRYGAVSALLGAGGEVNISRLKINYTIFLGANNSLYNSLNKSALIPIYNNALRDIDYVYSFGVAAGLGYEFNRYLMLQIGGGFMGSLSDAFVDERGAKQFDKDFAIYINLPIRITRSFAILPEIAYLDNLNDGYGKKEGLTMYGGVHFIAKF